MLLDVFHGFRQERRSNHRIATEYRVLGVVQMRLDVPKVVLLREGIGRLANRHGDVLIGCVHLLRRGRINHQFVDARHLNLLHETLDYSLLVKQLRVVLHHGHNGLRLGHPLRFREDVRVRDRDNICYASKILTLNVQILNNLTAAHIIQIPAVDSAQNFEYTTLRFMQSGVNSRENSRALLNHCLSGAYRSV